jgi:hypothetical protein
METGTTFSCRILEGLKLPKQKTCFCANLLQDVVPSRYLTNSRD